MADSYVFLCLYRAHTRKSTLCRAERLEWLCGCEETQIRYFTHRLARKAPVLEVPNCDTPIEIFKVSMCAKKTAKEYPLVLQWLRAHVARNSHLLVVGGDF